MILTRSYYAFQGKNGSSRDGLLSVFDEEMNLIRDKDLNKRNWYLADGKTSFFVFSKSFRANSIYVLRHEDRELYSFFAQYLLESTLSQMDILLRIVNPNHFSIITGSGIEFVNLEGVWHARNYAKLIPELARILGMSDRDTRTLLFYIIQLSQKCRSSIIFVPEATAAGYVASLASIGTNILGNIAISEKMYTNTLFRIMSSDGVTIVDQGGKLISHGAIVKLNVTTSPAGKLVGTGQVASRTLAQYGTSVKISSDGTITLVNSIKGVEMKF
jgi:hypothetical protein